MKSLILVFHENGELFSEMGEVPYSVEDMGEICLKDGWTRSICESIAYPNFSGEKEISLPDSLAEEMPEFSGFVRYETTFRAGEGEKLFLKIEDAHEGVEVFVNGISLGIEIAPPGDAHSHGYVDVAKRPCSAQAAIINCAYILKIGL